MKRKLIALLIAATMLAGLFSGCTGANAPPPPPTPAEEGAYVAPEPLPAEIDPLPRGMHEAIRLFSHTLFQEVLALSEENPVISPLSAYFALAMVALGANGETLDEFVALLGRMPHELAADLLALSRDLKDTAGSTALQIAGSVWIDDSYTVNPAFATAMADYFNAQALSRDFDAPETVDEINAWVAEQTEYLIDQVLDSIGRDAVMLLINTLYFSGKWADAFNPMTEYQGTFHPATGSAVEVPFLSTGTGAFPIAVTDQFEATLLPYDDDRLGFLLVRPTDGTSVRDFAAAHDLSGILALLEESPEAQIRMPKLDLEYEVRLNNLLQAMGLEKAFGDLADLSGLIEEDERLHISQVLQKVRLLVDEEGTEAAAVTVVTIERASIDLNLIELTFDTPYLYAIVDLETGIPLFMGVLDNPA
ncbi:MAG: serpin family protein [Oscillospiraceae bacterium]|nr:serpin family protein [Oscillospiraceae bacterium]